MALMTSISGIRGTVGGVPGENLTPPDVVQFTATFGAWLQTVTDARCVVVGRDTRPTGAAYRDLVCATLHALGFDTLDLGITTTPTLEMAIPDIQAAGGIMLSASHNPRDWNALKLMNAAGEFLTPEQARTLLARYAGEPLAYVAVDQLGKARPERDFLQTHLDAIAALDLVDLNAIQARGLRVAVDAVNGSGSLAVPRLLQALGVAEIHPLHCTPDGQFPHNPEPRAEHLGDLCSYVETHGLDLGLAVDPDVDRLALVGAGGRYLSEELTLVLAADYVLSQTPGATVSNLSSSRALRDVTEQRGGTYHAAAVGEINVVLKMKEVGAVIGGEGNGGVIYPPLHYGRDALVGIALLLTALARSGEDLNAWAARMPRYAMQKEKVVLPTARDLAPLWQHLAERYPDTPRTTMDGLKLDFAHGWVHLRPSNTEPIVRIYAEAPTEAEAQSLTATFCREVNAYIQGG